MEHMKLIWQMRFSLFMIALHVLSVALNMYVLVVIRCGTDHQLQSAMIINTVHHVLCKHSAKTYK